MNIPTGIFKSYDIRGTYPDEINEENIYAIVQAVYGFYAEYLKKETFTILIAHDMRLSVPKLYPIVTQALQDTGCSIIDIGLAATPTYYFAILHNKADAGIILSASHNPSHYSGLKLVIREGNTILKVRKGWGMDEIISNAQKKYAIKREQGQIITISDSVDQEINYAFELINPKSFQLKKYKIVTDTANGMGITCVKPLFEKLQLPVTYINEKLDGSFPSHEPNPLVEKNLTLCKEMVIKTKADMGICPDGDGDRYMFIDEKGNLVKPSIITAIVAREILRQFPHAKIVYDVRYVLNAKKIIEENGGESSIICVGHSHITKNLNDIGAIFAGESSGHYFFAHTGGAESQIPVILYLFKALSDSGKSLSELSKSLQRSFESGEFNFKTDKSVRILEKLKDVYKNGILNTIDGISIDYPTWRFNVRTSNTEPLLRLNVESLTEDEMKKELEKLIKLIESEGAVKHDD